MSDLFRQTVDERALSLADIDSLIERHRDTGLCVITAQGRLVSIGAQALPFTFALLQLARFGFLVREAAAANPGLSADSAIAVAEERLRRER